MGLRRLETESPIDLEDYEESIKKTGEKQGKRVKAFFYLYPPLLFRFLPRYFQKMVFHLLNRHVTMVKRNGKYIIEKYEQPDVMGNILDASVYISS